MGVETQQPMKRVEFLSRHKLLVGAVLAGVVMLLLGRFWLDGPPAGMFGIWGGTLVLAAIGSHLALRLWTLYGR